MAIRVKNKKTLKCMPNKSNTIQHTMTKLHFPLCFLQGVRDLSLTLSKVLRLQFISTFTFILLYTCKV